MEESDFPQLGNNVLELIQSIKCKSRSSKKSRTSVVTPRIYQKKVNKQGFSFPICFHNKYRARCVECKLPNDKKCTLPNFNKSRYKDEKCDCSSCLISDKITKGEICFVCKKNKTFRFSRCQDCFKIFTKKRTPNTENQPVPDNIPNPQLLPIQDVSKIIREVDFSSKKSGLIKDSIDRLNEIICLINNKNSHWKIEKSLTNFLKILTSCAIKRENIVQLIIAENHLEKIGQILDFCKEEKLVDLILEIIWYLILNNPTVMIKIKLSSVFGKIEKMTDCINNNSYKTIEKINSHFQLYKIS